MVWLASHISGLETDIEVEISHKVLSLSLDCFTLLHVSSNLRSAVFIRLNIWFEAESKQELLWSHFQNVMPFILKRLPNSL